MEIAETISTKHYFILTSCELQIYLTKNKMLLDNINEIKKLCEEKKLMYSIYEPTPSENFELDENTQDKIRIEIAEGELLPF